jgi:predicted PurR-regulated permease PerM
MVAPCSSEESVAGAAGFASCKSRGEGPDAASWHIVLVDTYPRVGERSVCQGPLGEPQRQMLHLGIVCRLNAEAESLEQPEHRSILGQDCRDELLQAGSACELNQVAQECRTDPVSLIGIDYDKGHFGLARARDDIACAAHDRWLAIFIDLRNERDVLIEIDVGEESDFFLGEFQLRDEKPTSPRLSAGPANCHEQILPVVRAKSAYIERPAITEILFDRIVGCWRHGRYAGLQSVEAPTRERQAIGRLDLDQASRGNICRLERAAEKILVEDILVPAAHRMHLKMPLRVFREGRSSEEVIQLAVRLGLLAALIYWCFVLVRPFILILAWGAVLAVALYPLYTWLSDHLGHRPRLSAGIITVFAVAIVIGPAAWLALGLVEGLRAISDQVGSERLVVIPSPPSAIRDWPLVGESLYSFWNQASTNLEAAFAQLAPHLKPLVRSVLAIAGSASLGMLKFLASVILAGFLLPSGPKLVAVGRNVMARLMPQRSHDFVALAGATIRTVSQGVIGIALLQSFLFGIGLKLAGVSSAGLLAFAVLILGILQIGSAIVLIPCLVWIWATKPVLLALLLTIYLVMVGLADNVLKPLLMGRALTTPMLVIFIGLLGGTFAHGIVGLFVGPIILAVGWELMKAWMRDEPVTEVPGATDHRAAEI